jgi:hypothetical protein
LFRNPHKIRAGRKTIKEKHKETKKRENKRATLLDGFPNTRKGGEHFLINASTPSNSFESDYLVFGFSATT